MKNKLKVVISAVNHLLFEPGDLNDKLAKMSEELSPDDLIIALGFAHTSVWKMFWGSIEVRSLNGDLVELPKVDCGNEDVVQPDGEY